MSAATASERVSQDEWGCEQPQGEHGADARGAAREQAQGQGQAEGRAQADAQVRAQALGQHGHGHRTPPEHTDPEDVSLTTALAALADPMRLRLVRELADSADWERTCGSFSVPIGKAALSHHFAVLRAAGILEQRDFGAKRANRLRREEFERRFPGLLTLALREGQPEAD